MTEKNFNLVFPKNLKRYLELNNMTQKELANKLGVGTSSVSSWVTGQKFPRMSKVDAMCKIFNCNRSDLMEEHNNKKQTVKASRIPVLGSVRCGIPLDAIEDIIDYEEVPEKMNYDGKLFGLRVKGDSMYPPIRDGDTLIVHEQPDAETNEVVIAMVNGNEATCKELKKVDDGIMLVPWNKAYDTMFFSWKQVETLPVRIVGKVVEMRSKL